MIPVSVVIPCYRCSDTIERAVASVDRQTRRPSEVILIDDASGDETLDKLKLIKHHFGGWVRVIELAENRGAASARNRGWAASSQPFIAFLDADDSWHEEKLRVQYEFMRENADVAVSGHRCLVWSDNQDLPNLVAPTIASAEIGSMGLLFKNAFSTPSVMLKRELAFRFPEGQRHAEDVRLWQEIALAGFKIVRLEAPLAFLHKAPYGAGGLSGNLWQMEAAELKNFVQLWETGRLSIWMLILASGFSLAKFVRRFLVDSWRRTSGRNGKASLSNNRNPESAKKRSG